MTPTSPASHMVKNTTTQPRPHQSALDAFNEFEKAGAARTPSWLQALRKGGIAHFAELGFPTTRHEEWRFTNIAPIARMPFKLAGGGGKLSNNDVERVIFPGVPGKRVVFVDGKFQPDLSSKELASSQGIRVMSLEEASRGTNSLLPQNLARYARYDENAFVALNTAFVADGALVHLPARHQEQDPVYLVYISTGAVSASTQPRTLIVAERDSNAKIIEHYLTLGDAECFTNSVTEIILDESARVEHCKVQEESRNTYHVATIQTRQARNSHLTSHSISTGGLLARNNINCADGERVVTCSEHFTARIWSTFDGRPLVPPLRHRYQVHGAAFDETEEWIVTASWDRTSIIWDTQTGDQLTPAFPFGEMLVDAQFAAGQNAIVARGASGSYMLKLPLANAPFDGYHHAIYSPETADLNW